MSHYCYNCSKYITIIFCPTVAGVECVCFPGVCAWHSIHSLVSPAAYLIICPQSHQQNATPAIRSSSFFAHQFPAPSPSPRSTDPPAPSFVGPFVGPHYAGKYRKRILQFCHQSCGCTRPNITFFSNYIFALLLPASWGGGWWKKKETPTPVAFCSLFICCIA